MYFLHYILLLLHVPMLFHMNQIVGFLHGIIVLLLFLYKVKHDNQ